MQIGGRNGAFSAETTVYPAVVELTYESASMHVLGNKCKITSSSSPASVSWGDGTTDIIPYSDNMIVPEHYYAAYDTYNITIACPTLTSIGSVEGSTDPIIIGEGDNKSVIAIYISDNVQPFTIGQSCFRGYSWVYDIDIPETVIGLSEYSFADMSLCNNTLNIPEGITTLPAHCFDGNPLLRINLPSTLTSIGEECFGYANDLRWVDCSATTPPTITATSFASSEASDLYVPAASVSAYAAAAYWRDFYEIIGR